MGRKSRKRLLLKPFCYFCNREFDDEKVLVQHQKAKHFKCGECNRKLETANGLAVHMQQVHKLIQRKVPYALEGRDNVNSVVQGMHGVPFDAIEEHQLKHHKKMGDIDSRKQQRISWAIVSTAPTAEQFLAQLAVGNIYFPGFTTVQEAQAPPQRQPIMPMAYNHVAQPMPGYGQGPSSMPLQGHQGPYSQGQPHRSGGHGGGAGSGERRGRRFSDGSGANGFSSRDDMSRAKGFGPSGSGPLILGPSGVPIDPAQVPAFRSTNSGGRPLGVPAGTPTGGAMSGIPAVNSAPRGFSNGPPSATINLPPRNSTMDPNQFQKSAGFSGVATAFSKPAGFSDAPGFSKPAGFSDAPGASRPSQGFSAPKGFSDAAPSDQARGASSGQERPANDRPRFVQTQYYKATGSAPLFIPPPTLETTKLAFDADGESIEEKRAKLLHNWKDIS
ncbi:zinc finger protein, putative [Babesia caballi]|uniref:Zinc finger protein, putative n=1 Tax=Babesia caballi TaxID=5871 RepID=A0AAV4LZL2_BABCB|nr:zinc finger protein, putative [Babesia caballi]